MFPSAKWKIHWYLKPWEHDKIPYALKKGTALDQDRDRPRYKRQPSSKKQAHEEFAGMTFAVKYLLFALQPLPNRKRGREKSTSHTLWPCPFEPLSRRSSLYTAEAEK